MKTRHIHAICSCGWQERISCDADDEDFVQQAHGMDMKGEHAFTGEIREFQKEPAKFQRKK